ncbi:Uncharacterized protein OBRU01_16656 [Operophtera brumata]|uniref:Uncharacterized protein n=1 Tax=Operophtera brumata TaxID=104452 RepID=A0A0L7L2B7_OPEBR|nr:Uncharacterized protein OBRU01_16656 [Operophtera brumata]
MLVPTCALKLFELVLAVACLILHHYSYDLTDLPTLMLCSGTYIGFVIVLSGEIIGEMIFAPLDLVQDVFFGTLGIALFATSGGLLISASYQGSSYPKTGDSQVRLLVGSLAILNAVIMLFDLSLAYLDSEEYDEEASLNSSNELTGEAVSAAADAYIDAWWSASGGALFGACAVLTLSNWRDIPACQRRSYAQAAAGCASAACALLIIDTLLALCSAHRDGSSSRKSLRTNPCS